MSKELFADYVKETKLSEPEEKKELVKTFKTYILCRSKKERIRSMYSKTIIRFGFCDIQNNQRHQPRPSASPDNPYLTLIILNITKTSSNNCLETVFGTNVYPSLFLNFLFINKTRDDVPKTIPWCYSSQ